MFVSEKGMNKNESVISYHVVILYSWLVIPLMKN